MARALKDSGKMRGTGLLGVLSGIVTTVIATSTGLIGGCGEIADGGSSGTGEASADASSTEEDSFLCAPPLADVMTNLKPATPADYIEIRAQQFDCLTQEPARDGDAGTPLPDGGVLGQLLPTAAVRANGTPCATANNRDLCLEALAALRIEKGQGFAIEHVYGPDCWPTSRRGLLVFTRGDEVGAAVNVEELAAFLGTVDTLEEARLLAMARIVDDLKCVTTPFKGGWRHNADGSWELLITGNDCGNPTQQKVTIAANGAITLGEIRRKDTGSVCGRRTEGLARTALSGDDISVGAWLAEAAHLEAASVIAFRRLEEELLALGAPRALAKRARASRADEIRHARTMTRLAHRFGATPPAVHVEPIAERTPFEIALENAVEGCVRETYGALVAEYQARTATDPEIRAALRGIARDEARHAALAHDIAAWLEPRLDDEERAAIARARDAALEDLRAAVLQPPADDVAGLAGMPRPPEALGLLAGLERVVLARAA